MRIAHITATFPPYRGGTGTIAYYNALGAAHLGHEVHVFTGQPSASKRIASGHDESDPPELQVHRFSPVFQVGNAPLLPQFMGINSFDIIHLHYPFIFGQEMMWMRDWLRRHPYVITYHQDILLTGRIDRAVRLHHRWVGRRVLLGARRVIATTLDYAYASRLAELAPRLGARLCEVPNGVDAARFHPARIAPAQAEALRARCGIDQDAFVFLFVGGLDRAHYFKGVNVLLEAFARLLAASASPAHLLIVGSGDLRSGYQEQAQQLGIQDRVTFAGKVGDSELPLYYGVADTLVLPSTTMGEAFGVVLLEALASEVPVIASNLPGVRTVVEEGVDGWLAVPRSVESLLEKMTRMSQNSDEARAMGLRGRKKIEMTYDWTRVIPRLMEVYHSVSRADRRSANLS